MIKPRLISLGARIPANLKRKIATYCDRKGIKFQFFITEAIEDKLAEVEQYELDNKIVDERLKSPSFTSKNDLENYVKGRKKSG